MTKRKTSTPKSKATTKSAAASGSKDNDAVAPPSPDGSDDYVVLARKYRPATFDDLIGQQAMVRTLRNAFKTGRIAQAYMLTGVRGVGKTTTARILARALNYEPVSDTGSNSDQSGPTVDMPDLGVHCVEIMESRHPDVIEMDAASNTGIDNVREIIESARYRPISARHKVFIIDEVHMLSKGAFNALLKTLEEPPPHVKFIFATTEIRKVPVTVLSRCQRFDLRRVEAPALIKHFQQIAEQEGATADPEAIALIARAAQGSVRDGLSLLDQALAISSGKVTPADVRAMLGLADGGRVFDLLDCVFEGRPADALELFAAIYGDGAEPVQLLADMADAVHQITRIKIAGAGHGADTMSKEERARVEKCAGKLSIPLLSRAWQMLSKGHEEVGRSHDTRAASEMVLIRLCYTATLPTPDDLMRKLSNQLAADASSSSDGPSSAEQPGQMNQQHAPAPSAQDTVQDISQNTVQDGGQQNRPGSFPDIVELAGAMRDIQLKIDLEERVRPVRIEPGILEICLDQGTAPGFANELAQKLTTWTGEQWMVSIAREGGGQTIAEERRARKAADREAVQNNPLLQAALKTFPGAELGEVRPLSPDGQSDDDAPSNGGQQNNKDSQAR